MNTTYRIARPVSNFGSAISIIVKRMIVTIFQVNIVGLMLINVTYFSYQSAAEESSSAMSADRIESVKSVDPGFGFKLSPCVEKDRIAEWKPNNDIINEMNGDISYWGDKVGLWSTLYWVALTMSFLFSALAASSLISDNPPFRMKSYAALVAAMATSFLATFNPQVQADRYKTAYLYLKSAVVAYRYDSRMTDCHLSQAYSTAESIVQRGIRGADSTATR